MSREQKIHQVIYNMSRKIGEEVAVNLNMEFDSDALDLIAELTLKKLLLYPLDLEAFEKHAKRSTITVDDVKLLVRRNDSLKELLDKKLHEIQSNAPGESSNPGVKRKRKAASST